MRSWARLHLPDFAIAVAGLGLALTLRISLLEFKSVDFFNYTRAWYNTLKDSGFEAFAGSFSNYNLPYLYLLYGVIRILPNAPALIATKIPSLLADFVAAWFAFRVVGLRHRASPFPLMAAFAVLFAPTVVLNSALWGQADAVYTSMLLASLYFLFKRRESMALLLFGLALSTKAQAVFLLPLLLGLLFRGDLRWRSMLWIPFAMLVTLIPALLAGRPLWDLVLIYPSQAAQYEQLSMHAPSFLALVPDGGRYYPYFYPAALILCTAAALSFVLAMHRSRVELTSPLILELALVSAMLIPFLLPKMHERYFFVADVLSLILVFYIPRLFLVPLLMISISFFAYQPALFGVEPVPMGWLALGVFLILTILTAHVGPLLFPRTTEKRTEAAAVQ